ncbi:MAG: DNA polymerase I [Flavobacteriales bacterium]|nr:DNA polymerase I [Flavobacteriales bacterium]
MRSKETPRKLFLLDAYALIFRAYYAFIRAPRINSKGLNTSAIFGFTNVLLDVIRNEKPSHIAVAFDPPGGSFRVQEYEEYKANRDATPEDIKVAVPYIMRIIEAFNIPILIKEGYEADDVVGTIAKKAEQEGFTVYMMTSDKDYGQLVSDQVFMFRPGNGGKPPEIWGIPEVCEKFDIERPDQVIDVLGLMGDAADNIPGIPGIGQKTAAKLLKQYDSVEGLIAHSHELKGKQKENVEQFAEQGMMSKMLATIITDVPVDFDEASLIYEEMNQEALKELFEELEFRSLAKRVFQEDLSPAGGTSEGGTVTERSGQIALFSDEEMEVAISTDKDTIETVGHSYHLANAEKDLNELIAKLEKAPSYCFDTETTGIDPLVADIVGMSFAIEPHEAWYVPTPPDREGAIRVIERFRHILEDPKKEIVAQNLKYDYKIMYRYGVEIGNKAFDTMISHYLMNPDMKHGMDVLSEVYLNYKPVSIETLIGKKGKNQKSMADVDPALVADYAAEDADVTLRLKLLFEQEMQQEHLQSLFTDIEIPLIKVLAHMEMEGVNIDKEALHKFSDELGVSIARLEGEIHEQAGEVFNVDSPRQLGDILFEKLKISSKAKKTKTGQYATSEDILSRHEHDHPIVPMILEYRQLRKLKSTYVDPLPEMTHPQTGRVHTQYMQTVAATGRLSSNNPNLQNIPIRTEKGREIRKAFIPRSDEFLLLSADYSQVELRIIAALSKDEHMCAAFNAGEDIHKATAARVFGVPLEEVDRDMRSKAKAVNFGIIYGQGAFGLAQNLNISRKEAKEIIDSYFEQFSSLKSYQEANIEFARANGYVETLMGRRRYLKDIHSANAVVRGFAERNAINAPIQGTAADIIKIAMIDIHKEFQKADFKSRMIMQVHDELVFDAHKDEVEIIQPIIRDKMQNAVKLIVPLKVDMDLGINWLEAH